MHLKLLIDGIVQQTTVLIARLSTSPGVRSPLGHIADQVFLELARELEQQGVRRVLAADMFGLALRSYQKKTQRLMESASVAERTLWEAVYHFIRSGEATRQRIEERFRNDGKREVAAVLADLLRSGLVYVTGSGHTAVYGENSARVREFVQASSDADALLHYVWFKIFHGEASTAPQLEEQLRVEPERVQAVLRELESTGRVTRVGDQLQAVNLTIPAGSSEGLETALVDHFRAVANVITERVRAGEGSKGTGGSTFSFKMTPEHPLFDEVMGLLERSRSDAQALWDRVMAVNEVTPPPEDALKITYYVGQSTLDPHSPVGSEQPSENESS